MTTFSKKHYQVIAKAVKETISDCFPLDNPKHNAGIVGVECLLDYLVEDFKKDNPNFNENKFMEACGFKERGR